MRLVDAIVLGIVEGITEYLPISSTFHILFVAGLLGVPQDEFLSIFAVFIQSGALLAVIVLYLREIRKNPRLLILACAAFVPTAVIALILDDVIHTIFFASGMLQLIAIGVVGVIFIILEVLIAKKIVPQKYAVEDMTIKTAIITGLIQSCAIIPGVSRAGAVLVALMAMGFKREEAARFSFLVALPTLFAASGYDLLKLYDSVGLMSQELLLLSVGFAVSGITAYGVVLWFLRYLKANTLIPFAVYRFLLIPLIIFTGYAAPLE